MDVLMTLRGAGFANPGGAQTTVRERGVKRSALLGAWLAVAVAAGALECRGESMTSDPQVLVEQITRSVTERLDEAAARLEADPEYITEIARDLVVPHVDFRQVAASTIPTAWDELSNGEQRCFTRAVRQQLVERYARVLIDYEFSAIRTDPVGLVSTSEPVTVTQTITTPNPQPMSVQYVMRFLGGAWKLVDLIVVDVCLVTSYRLSFACEVERQGLGDFLRTLPQCRER